MGNTLFVIDAAGHLTPLQRQAYATENEFQQLLANHPELLRAVAGETRRLLLVRREVPVPDSLESGSRWSLDHLFVDQEGVPVLVEVKRASDTRLRREVVGQMLDYAANGVAYWNINSISGLFSGDDAIRAASLTAHLEGRDPEVFWQTVARNLRSGHIRMVFVADSIPAELRRIIEFLNEQMTSAEVIGVEIEHFTGAGNLRLLTPRIVGRTERASGTKSVQPPKPPLSVDEWLASVRELHGDEASVAARKVADALNVIGFEVAITDSHDAMLGRVGLADGRFVSVVSARRSSARLELALINLLTVSPFDSEEERVELLRRMKELPTEVFATANAHKGWPSISLKAFLDDKVASGMRSLLEDVRQRILAAGEANANQGAS